MKFGGGILDSSKCLDPVNFVYPIWIRIICEGKIFYWLNISAITESLLH